MVGSADSRPLAEQLHRAATLADRLEPSLNERSDDARPIGADANSADDLDRTDHRGHHHRLVQGKQCQDLDHRGSFVQRPKLRVLIGASGHSVSYAVRGAVDALSQQGGTMMWVPWIALVCGAAFTVIPAFAQEGEDLDALQACSSSAVPALSWPLMLLAVALLAMMVLRSRPRGAAGQRLVVVITLCLLALGEVANSPSPALADDVVCVHTVERSLTRIPESYARFTAEIDGPSNRNYDVHLVLRPPGGARIYILLATVAGGSTVSEVIKLPAALTDGMKVPWHIRARNVADPADSDNDHGGVVTVQNHSVLGLESQGAAMNLAPQPAGLDVVAVDSDNDAIVSVSMVAVGSQTGIRFTPGDVGQTIVNYGTQGTGNVVKHGKIVVEVE